MIGAYWNLNIWPTFHRRVDYCTSANTTFLTDELQEQADFQARLLHLHITCVSQAHRPRVPWGGAAVALVREQSGQRGRRVLINRRWRSCKVTRRTCCKLDLGAEARVQDFRIMHALEGTN